MTFTIQEEQDGKMVDKTETYNIDDYFEQVLHITNKTEGETAIDTNTLQDTNTVQDTNTTSTGTAVNDTAQSGSPEQGGTTPETQNSVEGTGV